MILYNILYKQCYKISIYKGTSQLNFYVNKAPIKGQCSLRNNGTDDNPRLNVSYLNFVFNIFPYLSTFTSLVEEVEFVCKEWEDPENVGIKSYLLFSTDVTTNVLFFT